MGRTNVNPAIKLKRMLKDGVGFDVLYQYITDNAKSFTYEDLMTKKLVESIFNADSLAKEQRDILNNTLLSSIESHKKEYGDYIQFIINVYLVISKLTNQIEQIVRDTFGNSLFQFEYCLGMFIQEHPQTIHLAKMLLRNMAFKSLKNDLHIKVQSNITLDKSIYKVRKYKLKCAYEFAVEMGALIEQNDNIAFLRSYAMKTTLDNEKPAFQIGIFNDELEKSIMKGEKYNEYIYNKRKENFLNKIFYNYYKCHICRYCGLTDQYDEKKKLALEILYRQYKHLTMIDTMFFYTGTLPSYILSILSYLYMELIKLVIFSSGDVRLINKSCIKRNMLFNEYISEKDFELCIKLISNCGLQSNSPLQFFESADSIAIGSWMFDADLSIIEEAKNISFNSRKNSELGSATEFFGKTLFEELIRDRIEQHGWATIKHQVNIKENKKIVTDLDLIAYKNGIVIIGQVKVAHTGRRSYQLWKTKKTIENGINQMQKCLKAFNDRKDLLYSILKKDNIIKNRECIKSVLPLVITSNNYFSEAFLSKNITAIGFEMLDEILCYTNDFSNEELLSSLKRPLYNYTFNRQIAFCTSEINASQYKLTFQEYD